MRVEVAGSPAACADGLRTYVEHRVFPRLAPVADRVGTVRVIVRTLAGGRSMSCLIVADLGPAGSTHTIAESTEPSKAIDVAATQLEAAVQERLSRRAG